MDTASILLMALQGLTGAFCAVLYGVIQDLKRKAEKTAEDLASYKTLAAERFTSKTELKDSLEAINRSFETYSTKLDARLDRIEGKIDMKVDKRDI